MFYASRKKGSTAETQAITNDEQKKNNQNANTKKHDNDTQRKKTNCNRVNYRIACKHALRSPWPHILTGTI